MTRHLRFLRIPSRMICVACWLFLLNGGICGRGDFTRGQRTGTVRHGGGKGRKRSRRRIVTLSIAAHVMPGRYRLGKIIVHRDTHRRTRSGAFPFLMAPCDGGGDVAPLSSFINENQENAAGLSCLANHHLRRRVTFSPTTL